MFLNSSSGTDDIMATVQAIPMGIAQAATLSLVLNVTSGTSVWPLVVTISVLGYSSMAQGHLRLLRLEWSHSGMTLEHQCGLM